MKSAGTFSLLFLSCSGIGAFALKAHIASDACKCRSFHDVYKKGDAKCGDGLEAGDNLEDGCKLSDGQEIAWYLVQNHSYCIRHGGSESGAGEPDSVRATWCYVSSECQKLNGGKAVNGHVSAKYCTDEDPKLGDLYPTELFNVVSPWDLLLSVSYAYNYEGGDGQDDPDFDALQEPAGNYKSDCKQGKSTRLTSGGGGDDDDEDTVNVVCRQGKEKWFINDGIAECVRGCDHGTKLGGPIKTRMPRKERWMFGTEGPSPGDQIESQNDDNTFELTD